MTDKNIFFIFLSALILISACEEPLPQQKEIDDPITHPQFVFMRESNLLYFSASYELEFEGESLSSSRVEWYGQGGTVKDTVWLNDLGESGDIISADGLYSSEIINSSEYLSNPLDSSNVGSVNCTFIGVYGSNKVEVSYFNYEPVILSLAIPDSIVRPVAEEVDSNENGVFDEGEEFIDFNGDGDYDEGEEIKKILVVADIFDENGSEDISICGFTSMHVGPDTLLNNGNPIWLYDDGSSVEIFPNYYSGDEISGDGKFSIEILIFSAENSFVQTKTGTFLWTFVARDNSFEASAPVEHIIIVE